MAQGGGGGGANPQDIFAQFFGGGGFNFGFGGGEEETPKGDSIYAELEVTLADLYLGNTFKVVRDKNVIKPASGKRQCNCRNKMVTQQLGPGMYQQFAQKVCEECPNVKYVREPDTLSVSVESGMVDGQEIPFFEEGEPLIDGEPGDLIFVVRALPHPRFTRQGHDLHVEQTISLVDALTGFTMEIEHLDGHKVALGSIQVTKPGDITRVIGEGMPVFERGDSKGDMYVRFTVAFPKEVSEKQAKQLKELFKSEKWAHDEL
jgi:DnaJ family protein B protein 11